MLHPGFERPVMSAYGLHVAKLPVKHVERHRKSCRPGHIVAVIIPISRCHIGNRTIVALRLGNIVHPLGIERFIIEKKTLAPAAHGAIAQPGLALVALRTINRHTFVITPDSPRCVLQHLVQHFVGSCKISGMSHLIFHHLGHKIVFIGLISQTANFHVPETMVHKYRRPAFAFRITLQDIIIGNLSIAQVSGIQRAIFL